MTDDEDHIIAAQVVSGQKELFRLLVKRHEQAVYGMGMSFFRNAEDASDFTQEVFLKTFRNLSRFEGRSRFSTWLYQVTSNAAFDTYRRLKRRASVLGDNLEERAALERTSVVAGTHVDLLDALEEVDPRFATPVVLRDVCGLDYGEIAELLDVPAGTVKSRIHEGRRTLQWLLDR